MVAAVLVAAVLVAAVLVAAVLVAAVLAEVALPTVALGEAFVDAFAGAGTDDRATAGAGAATGDFADRA